LADIDEIKRRLRQLKKIEQKIRFGSAPGSGTSKLVWDSFFNLSGAKSGGYTLDSLAHMDKEAFSAVIDEYYYRVYYQLYRDNGLGYDAARLYDPELLAQLGLPSNADYETIKKRFRQLALKYHPDRGGDAGDFIKMMDSYKKLTGEK
jgi:hypothetical protein